MRIHRSRTLIAGLLGLSLGASLGACTIDEPADITPNSGLWLYVEEEIVSNTCTAEQELDPLSEFIIDYDEGDSFDIELGMEDITCEIDGVDFTCDRLLLTTVSLDVFGLDAMVSVHVTFEGSLSSETEATGKEIVTYTCEGPDCEDVPDVPCAYSTRFTASFQA